MHVKDTAADWKASYTGRVMEIPTTADIESFAHLADEQLRLPPALRRKAGRPTKKRLPSTLADFVVKRKRTMTCQVCFEKNHTKAHCPTLLASAAAALPPSAATLPPADAALPLAAAAALPLAAAVRRRRRLPSAAATPQPAAAALPPAAAARRRRSRR